MKQNYQHLFTNLINLNNMEIITGEMDGEKIVRAETVFDKIEKFLDEKVLEETEEGDRIGEINGVDSDEYRDNEEDR